MAAHRTRSFPHCIVCGSYLTLWSPKKGDAVIQKFKEKGGFSFTFNCECGLFYKNPVPYEEEWERDNVADKAHHKLIYWEEEDD